MLHFSPHGLGRDFLSWTGQRELLPGCTCSDFTSLYLICSKSLPVINLKQNPDNPQLLLVSETHPSSLFSNFQFQTFLNSRGHYFASIIPNFAVLAGVLWIAFHVAGGRFSKGVSSPPASRHISTPALTVVT